jgi:hypothetical protein
MTVVGLKFPVWNTSEDGIVCSVYITFFWCSWKAELECQVIKQMPQLSGFHSSVSEFHILVVYMKRKKRPCFPDADSTTLLFVITVSAAPCRYATSDKCSSSSEVVGAEKSAK